MAKRYFLALLAITLAAGGAYAQFSLSLGGGGNFIANFDSLTLDGGKISVTTAGGGFFGFLDLTYVELDGGIVFGAMQSKMSGGGFSDTNKGPNVIYVTFGAFGKYPINLADSITLFPMLGLQFDLGFRVLQNGERVADATDTLNRFWVKFGGGADFFFTQRLFLRPTFLWGTNFGTKVLNDWKSLSSAKSFYHGLDIRVAMGFKII